MGPTSICAHDTATNENFKRIHTTHLLVVTVTHAHFAFSSSL